ncbi:hypothetical protein TraAM80_06802 [Trypanosoma rangeli]|uniref:Uncharacterized protein n=1 Tax=Trypanosoma rangeli TaxID=5698 RepID=A0A422N8M0_TRYRA|nr:uncharacterized protein TraAM80_06802 [Trypanosoma rangeli]RNF01805.1 hypothetical protein TraAM80_06802 [Trypanosoma rangeli]|eukprot:RNF01805.1 hypothetical protein TraAM80_06802 [Trypanosoma rangeli]
MHSVSARTESILLQLRRPYKGISAIPKQRCSLLTPSPHFRRRRGCSTHGTAVAIPIIPRGGEGDPHSDRLPALFNVRSRTAFQSPPSATAACLGAPPPTAPVASVKLRVCQTREAQRLLSSRALRLSPLKQRYSATALWWGGINFDAVTDNRKARSPSTSPTSITVPPVTVRATRHVQQLTRYGDGQGRGITSRAGITVGTQHRLRSAIWNTSWRTFPSAVVAPVR